MSEETSVSKSKINTNLLQAIGDPTSKDAALKDILLDLDARISKMEKIGWLILVGLAALGGKEIIFSMITKL